MAAREADVVVVAAVEEGGRNVALVVADVVTDAEWLCKNE